ncbi:hypothetical protein [Streptacidiphilus rugosus]|uniref:hypothetical protein n=1 Tax=Streptacidiphilus rugosus TaxID=405783 RepID=UPI0005687692|nr:hypothetical protein [Streptacidiphilus rugosus]
MVRTTPPRPVDIGRHFPELAPLARTAVRLHPRAGRPTAAVSSVGGPLLWPADEPWPVCPDHAGPSHVGTTPENARRVRRLLSRRARSGEDVSALLRRIPHQEEISQDGPLPLLPVAQLYAADVPGLPCPDGADLLQVLWCSFTDHDEPWVPRTVLRWRTAAEVRDPLDDAPQPSVVSHRNYLPEPCVLHPEPVTEYPHVIGLPRELRQRIEAWEGRHGSSYHDHLSVAPGCKAGGHVRWSLTDAVPLACAECGSNLRPLLTIADWEWDDEDPSWRPVEESTTPLHDDISPAWATKLWINRGYSLQLYVCEASWDHPRVQRMQ